MASARIGWRKYDFRRIRYVVSVPADLADNGLPIGCILSARPAAIWKCVAGRVSSLPPWPPDAAQPPDAELRQWALPCRAPPAWATRLGYLAQNSTKA
jgi:hypothetical protein